MIHPDVLYICDYKVTLWLCQSDILILIELARIGTISTIRARAIRFKYLSAKILVIANIGRKALVILLKEFTHYRLILQFWKSKSQLIVFDINNSKIKKQH